MSTPIIFVVGTPFGGKTSFIEDFDVKAENKYLNENGVNYDIKDDVVKCLFPAKEYLFILKLIKAEKITQNNGAKYINDLYMEKVLKCIEKAKRLETAVIVENHPVYFQWMWSNISIYHHGPWPSRKTIIKFIEADTRPLCTYVIEKITKEKKVYKSKVAPEFNMTLHNMNAIRVKERVIMNAPSKNTGTIFTRLKNDDEIVYGIKDTIIWDRNARELRFIGGAIASGKSTLMDNMGLAIDDIPVKEPIEEIEKILTMELPDGCKQQIREEAIDNIMRKTLQENVMLNMEGNIIVERNILYSSWIFGSNEDKYPSIDMDMVHFIEKLGLSVSRTAYIDVTFQEAQERMVKRARKSDLNWDTESLRKIWDRLQLLYNNHWGWALADSYKIENKDFE